jgi:hemerythrin-like metal-binding protein
VEALNQLYAAMDQGTDKEEIVKVLNFLRDYTVMHFSTEESLMIQHNYPDASAHFAAHSDLVIQVSDFMSNYRTGNIVGMREMLKFLENWLVGHIQGKDKALGAYLKGRGAEV